MCWILLLLLSWLFMVVLTYMVFYYESANGPHLELLRSRGSLLRLLLKGFFGTLYSQLLLVTLTFTTLHRRFWRLPSGPADRTPIVFIHGLYHNRTAWYLYLRWFRKWGWQHVKAINLTGKFRSIEDYTQILAREIDEILAETGRSEADLVGHSMGGLIIRSYLTENSAKAKVRKVVTLGSPHAGSKLGVFGVGTAVKEMLPGSPFLVALNQAEIQVRKGSGFYSIYSIVDNMVLPNESAILTGGGVKNIETRTVNHVGLVFCKHTARLVRQCLVEP
jgi:pimeloyl-ACP methyl ester carboxylesterase